VPRQAGPGAPWQRGIRSGQVFEGQLAPAAHHHVGGVAKAAAEPEADRQRQPARGRDEETRR
jgi:hypothetical protein